jgi:hypothetical protein
VLFRQLLTISAGLMQKTGGKLELSTVAQGTEKPCVGGSIPTRATFYLLTTNPSK